jgi:hypothetical protein
MKPWRIAVFSMNFLSTSVFSSQISLSPGYCPYYPSLTLESLYLSSLIVNEYFNSPQGITTFAWQEHVEFPGI